MKFYLNEKPSVEFDKKYGTNVSYEYDFHPYDDQYLWNVFINCLDEDDEDACEEMDELLPFILSKFPDEGFESIFGSEPMTVVFGMLSGYHPKDIIQYVSGITYKNNIDAKEFEENMREHVDPDFNFNGWVPSYYTLKKLNKFFNF